MSRSLNEIRLSAGAATLVKGEMRPATGKRPLKIAPEMEVRP